MVTDGSTIMIAEGLDILYFSAIALILVFLTIRAKKKEGILVKSSKARSALRNNGTTGRIFKRQHLPALKNCPKCAEQLPPTALICDACDYNFLSRMVGHRHKLLPSSEPLGHEASRQTFAYRGWFIVEKRTNSGTCQWNKTHPIEKLEYKILAQLIFTPPRPSRWLIVRYRAIVAVFFLLNICHREIYHLCALSNVKTAHNF